jgi:endonuclease I
MTLKWVERKEFFVYVGSFEEISSIRFKGMEKWRGKNEPMGISSKKYSFRGQKREECRWIDVSVALMNFYLSYPLRLFKQQARKIRLNEGVDGAF